MQFCAITIAGVAASEATRIDLIVGGCFRFKHRSLDLTVDDVSTSCSDGSGAGMSAVKLNVCMVLSLYSRSCSATSRPQTSSIRSAMLIGVKLPREVRARSTDQACSGEFAVL